MVQKNNLLQESIEFVTNNINATTHEVPIHLLEYWAVQSDISACFNQKDKPKEFIVFMYALTKYNETQGKEEFEFTTKELISLFESFQILVSLGIINQTTETQSNPIKLFDFNNYEHINIEIL